MVTGEKMKSLYTRQKTLEKNPNEDVSKTVKNFLTPSNKNHSHPRAIQYGIEKEEQANLYYCRIMKKNPSEF